MMSTEWQAAALIPLPSRRDYPIAIVGAGGIVNDAHLPAYRKAGFAIVGIYDRDSDRARRTALRFDIPTVYASLDELLAGPCRIVDIAVPSAQNLAVAARVAEAGKAMLIQKPLAEDLRTALAIVRTVEAAGVIAAVNQQARWMPAALAMRNLIERGLLGEIYQVSFLNNVLTPWDLWPWMMALPQFEVLYHSIHYLDMLRTLVDREPRLVFADGSTLPGYSAKGETRTVIQVIFDGQLRATIMDSHHNIGGLSDQSATIRVEGTEGTAVAELGLSKNYPVGMPDSFRYCSRRLQAGTWISPSLGGTWFPDAFVGTMASVMRALEGEPGAPETSVRDNLGTLRLVFAAYESMTQRRLVDPASL
jgi:predicted dehydrogenase